MGSDFLAAEAIELVRVWLTAARDGDGRENRTGRALQDLVGDPGGVRFAMRLVDRVMRPQDNRTAAEQLGALVDSSPLPPFVSGLNRWGLRMGARLAPLLPAIVMPLARWRLRSHVRHLVVDARPGPLQRHVRPLRDSGFALNLNMLGEAVLGEAEAERRLRAICELIERGEVDYVSVKLSSIASQLNYWDWEGSLERVTGRLRELLGVAAAAPPVFVNLDMEEYHDLEIALAAFKSLLSGHEFHGLTAGVVLQAYLPDSFAALRDLVTWAGERRRDGGGEIKIRIVKGANLAMERVDAAMHGWQQAPYATKAEVDANYKRLLDWVLTPRRTAAVRIGIGSHNLFDVAWAHLLSQRRGVAHRVQFEMLQGMAPAQSRVVKEAAGGGSLLLYTPIVAPESFDVAIGYLFRRLEENTTEGNFLRVLFDLSPDSAEFHRQAEAFRVSVARRFQVSDLLRRQQSRPQEGSFASRHDDASFVNEPDTDPALSNNRAWARGVIETECAVPSSPVLDSAREVDRGVSLARNSGWHVMPAGRRRLLLHRAADRLATRRGDLINAMVHEAGKTFAEADPEVSEAIDFARYYGDRSLELEPEDSARFSPLGVVAVIPPWNFPVAIPAGGTFAALAAGNSALLKPSDLTPRCAEIVAECAWAAGVPEDALQLLRIPEGEVSKHLIMSVDGVILTGSAETAKLFRGWRPELRLFAETSGKNALIITAHADLDQAVRDLVASAFGHSGQKCSAASLAICVGPVTRSERFRQQLTDAVRSLAVGPATDLGTTMGPLASPAEGKLLLGLTRLQPGEEWLVRPVQRDEAGSLWTPGVRMGVRRDSWFFRTECFGPVLGVMEAATLQGAIEIQNSIRYGLTGGIHSLDPGEVETWLEQVEVGNAYVNRVTTGAVVQRQPFGGWKKSNVGPGAKAGGPNYVRQLGTWHPSPTQDFLADAAASDDYWWRREFSRAHDPAGLFCEANLLRYRPVRGVVIRAGRGAAEIELARVRAAVERCGVPYRISVIEEEDDRAFCARLSGLDVERIRILGEVPRSLREAANHSGIHLADGPVTANGRVELLTYLKEQTVSRTLHRFGNLADVES